MENVIKQIKTIIKEVGKLDGIPDHAPDDPTVGEIQITFTGPYAGSIVEFYEVDRHSQLLGEELQPREVINNLPRIMDIVAETIKGYAHNEKELWARVERIKEVI